MADYYSIIVGEVGMRGIKGTAQEVSEPLMSAINKCFEQDTDGIAVQQQHQEWAKDVMLETLQEHLDGVRIKVKVDLA